jgi:hypothetical protein
MINIYPTLLVILFTTHELLYPAKKDFKLTLSFVLHGYYIVKVYPYPVKGNGFEEGV